MEDMVLSFSKCWSWPSVCVCASSLGFFLSLSTGLSASPRVLFLVIALSVWSVKN